MQARLPVAVLLKVFRHMPGEEDVTSIAAVHHSLRDIDAGASNVGLLIKIADLINWPAMNAHADVQFGMAFQRLSNFYCAQDWRFRTGAKDERTAISCRQTK